MSTMLWHGSTRAAARGVPLQKRIRSGQELSLHKTLHHGLLGARGYQVGLHEAKPQDFRRQAHSHNEQTSSPEAPGVLGGCQGEGGRGGVLGGYFNFRVL